jgi:hypothetical protein
MTFVIRSGTPNSCNHCACLVEAVGIEPKAQRYANPKRTLGFIAYHYQRHATRTLTHVPCGTLESSGLPCALVTMWSLTFSGWANVMAVAFIPRGTQGGCACSRRASSHLHLREASLGDVADQLRPLRGSAPSFG